VPYGKYYKTMGREFQILFWGILVEKDDKHVRKMAVDQKKMLSYNIFDKRTVGQCTPDRRIKHQLKIAPYFIRAGALFFMRKSNNKSYDCTKHNYKSK